MSRLPEYIGKVVCYIRKSREDEEAELRGEDTLFKQRDMMVRDVLSHYSIDYDLAQEVASGDSIKDRPVFRSLLPRLGTDYQGIACKDLSRLGRGSYGDMGIVYDIIRDRRIFIITKDSVYDPRNFSDLRMIRFSLFFNREEYEMTLWRLTEGKYDGATKGKWVAGAVPFGYQYCPKEQILIPNTEEANIVRLVFELYANNGLGFRAIASQLRRFGYKSPRGKDLWHPEVIHRMLSNRAYIGTVEFRKTQRSKFDGKKTKRPVDEHIVVENAFPGIVEADLWTITQTRLKKGQDKPKVKLDFSPSELAGIIRCHQCKRKMIRQSSTQNYTKQDGTQSRYIKEFLYCAECGYAIKYRDCEKQILAILEKLKNLDNSALMSSLQGMLTAKDMTNSTSQKDIAIQLGERRDLLVNRLERAREFLLDGTFDKMDYESAKAKYEKDLEELESAIALVERTNAPNICSAPLVNLDQFRSHIDSALQSYNALDDKSRKNALLHSIFYSVHLHMKKTSDQTMRRKQFDLYVLVYQELFL